MTSRLHVHLTGYKELLRTLDRIATKDASRIGKNAVRAGVRVGAKKLRQSVPVGETKETKKSIGSAVKKKKGSGGNVVGYWGVNVGLKGERSKHAAAVIGGSKERFHKSGKSTGKIPASDLVSASAEAAQPAIMEKMAEVVRNGINKLKK